MQFAEVRVRIGTTEADNGTLSTVFYADTEGFARVGVVGTVDGESSGIHLSPRPYAELKRLFGEAESVSKQLASISQGLPWRHIDLPMTLKIDLGKVLTAEQVISVSLAVDETNCSFFGLYLSDREGNKTLTIFREKNYRKLKELIRTTDETIARLMKEGKAPAGFLEA